MILTINVWLLLTGAVAGLVGAFFARGRNRLIKAAGAGALVAVLMQVGRGIF